MNLAEKITKRKELADTLRRLDSAIEEEMTQRGPITEEDEASMLDFQQKADSVFTEFSRRAPPPMVQERPAQYRRRIVNDLKKYSPRWRDVDISTVPSAAILRAVAPQVFADAIACGQAGGDLRPEEIVERKTVGPGGHTVSEFRGGSKAHFVRQFEPVLLKGTLPTYREAMDMVLHGERIRKSV